ncbi:hypothetical protein, partial [Mesorhizobium sp.]|uniref:hypothetical protein n=1 Tax=Mesorhizobium sp. TaxID=1871066 RepID=UPI0025C6F72E
MNHSGAFWQLICIITAAPYTPNDDNALPDVLRFIDEMAVLSEQKPKNHAQRSFRTAPQARAPKMTFRT